MRSRKQKIGVVFLVMGVFMTGCSRNSATDSRIEIVLWSRPWWGDPAQYQNPSNPSVPALQWQAERVAEFERAHPKFRVRCEIDPGADKLRLAFASHTSPDVFFVGGDNQVEVMRCAQLGLLEPIDAFLPSRDLADIWQSALDTGRVGNDHYLWPLYNHALVILINESLCKERGVAHLLPKEDEDWDIQTFLKVAHALTFDRDGDGHTNVYGVGFCGLGDVQYLYTTWIANFGARIFDHKQGLVFNSPGTVEGLRFLRSLPGKEGVAPPGMAGYRIMDLADLFFGQKIGMMLGNAGLVDYGKLQVQTGRVRPFRWGLAPIPVAQKGEHCVSYLAVGAVVVSRETDQARREAAMELARYITSPELNRWFWSKWASPRRSTPLPEDRNMRMMMKLVQHAEDFLLPPVALNPRYDLQRQLDLFYQRIFSSNVPIETALAEFTEQFNREALKDVKNWPSVRSGEVHASF